MNIQTTLETQLERRRRIHAEVVADPEKHLKQAFGITRASDSAVVDACFIQCGAQTGVPKRQAALAARRFQTGQGTESFVLQCCSAKLAE